MKKAFSKKNLWDKTPLCIKATLGRGIGLLPTDFLLGKKFRENCKFISNSQFWSADEINKYQLKKLHEILTLAYEKTEFYHNMFDSVGFNLNDFKSLDYLCKLPIINKQTVIDNLGGMCTRPVTSSDVDYGSTGGTSGKPLQFYLDAGRSAIEYAYLTTSWQRTGYKLGMPIAVLRGRIVKPDKSGLYHEYDPILRYHYYSAFHLSDENIARYLEHISNIGDCFLHVYPSSASALAKYILRTGKYAPKNIKGIISESEIVYQQQREMIEEVFGCRIFSCYGLSEKVVLAAGCEKSDNYHVWPTYSYFELIDENGDSVTTPGRRGEIVGTGFMNTVMPFIRYRTGDWVTYVGDSCPDCGRKHTIIRDIVGHRTQEVLIAANGSEISWTSLNMHDDTFEHVRQFQFMQETPGKAILRIVKIDGFSNEDEKRIQQNLGRKFDGQLEFDIEFVNSIPLSPRGKSIYVDQKIKQQDLERSK